MAIYYVDFTTGDDGDTGLSEALAWKTIAKVNASSFSAGDSILFKRGEVWRETLTPPSSGSAGNPITFGAYGSGDEPIINGADLVATWTDASTGTYDFSDDFSSNNTSLWSSVTDPGGDMSAASGALVYTHNDSSAHYVAKTGLNFTSTLTVQWKMRFSADFALNTGGGTFVEIRKATDWVASYQLEGVGASITVRTKRNQPSNATVGSDFAIALNTDAIGKIVITGIGGASGTITFYLDGTQKNQATGLDFTTAVTAITEVRIGLSNRFGSPVTMVGTLTYDDIIIDADGSGGGVANTWSAAVATQPKIVWFDEVRGTPVGSQAACDGAGKWYWASNVLYVYSTTDPDSTFTTPGIEAAARDGCVVTNAKDYVTLDHLDCRNTNKINLESYTGSDHLTIQNCLVSGSFFSGISHFSGTDFTADANIIDDCGSCGITSTGDGVVDNTTITNNVITDCGWNATVDGYATYNAGIKVWGGKYMGGAGESDVCLIEGNEVSGQIDQFGDYSGTGIWIDQWGTGAVCRYNKVHDNEAYGIIAENCDDSEIYYNLSYGNNKGLSINRDATGHHVYNNVIYGNTLGGLICEGVGIQTTMVDNIFKNNISVGNGTQLIAILGGENAGGGSGNIYLNNCFGAEAANFITWGAATPDTYDAWEAAYGATTSSVEADPLMTDPGAGDFTLQAGSPCIDVGVDVGLTADYIGTSVPQGALPDIGAYELLSENVPSFCGSNLSVVRWPGFREDTL